MDHLFRPYNPHDETAMEAAERVRLAHMLRSIFIVCLISVVAFTTLAPLDPSLRVLRLITALPLVVLFALGLLLVRHGALRQASLLIVGGLWVTLAGISVFNGGVHAPAFAAMLIVVLLGGLLFGGRTALLLAALSIAFGSLHMLAVSSGLLIITPITHSDGSWLLAYTVYLLLAAQIIALVMGSVRLSLARAKSEIAERRAAEMALRASEDKFARAFRATPVGILITRISDNMVVEANDAFLRLSGLTREQTIGRHIDALGIWASTIERQRMRARLLSEGSVYDADFTFRRADGSLGTGLISAELVEMDGEPCTLGAIFDLSEQLQAAEERRRLEAQVLQAQKLESLGLLAGGIAHDFNNLMSSVMGNAGLALIDLPDNSTLRPSLLTIDQTARTAADLCQQLLAYAGKSELTVGVVDLAALVREMASLLHVSIEHHAQLSLDLEPGLPPTMAEASQIRQVVLNLVTNAAEAIEASGTGGQITLRLWAGSFDRAALSDLDATSSLEPGRYLALEVSDDGCGMDDETKQKIFDPFFTTKPSGHGLGLAAVLGIARQHGGMIGVRSAAGVGTTFTFLLPPAPDAIPAALQAPAPARQWATSGVVLVVDDEDAVRSLARRILERHGITAIEAADGHTAIESFLKCADIITAVLLDLTMPQMSGTEVLHALRQIRPDLPVLLTSGYSEQATMGWKLGGGRVGFIQKPYRPQELIDKLHELLAP